MRVLSADDIKAFPPPTWLAQGFIPEGSLTVLFGAPGVGKSFLALDLAHSVATDNRWLDKRTRTGPVVYVAAGEGVSGLRARIEAWEHEREVLVDNVSYITEAIPLNQSASVQKLMKVLKPIWPKLIVFDTLARCLPGANENAVEDMGLAVAAADDIRREFGATVLFVHHTGKPDDEGHTRGERGSTALPAAADVRLELVDGSGSERTLYTRKQKDAEPHYPLTITLKQVRRAGKTLSLVPAL